MTDSAQNIATTYDPTEIEKKWYKTWEDNGYFKPSQKGDAFSIMIPPPNVTGSLHMGHGFNNAIMDALTRYNRMTANVLCRQLAAQDISRHAVITRQGIHNGIVKTMTHVQATCDVRRRNHDGKCIAFLRRFKVTVVFPSFVPFFLDLGRIVSRSNILRRISHS